MIEQRLAVVVDGVSLYDEYGLILLDDSTFAPPEPYTNLVEVAGRTQGPLDLSEVVTGHPTFKQRTFTLQFAVTDKAKFDCMRSGLLRFLHNRRLPFSLGMDPGYMYTGRFKVSAHVAKANYEKVTIEVTVDPYKSAGIVELELQAQGGAAFTLESGDMPVQPTFTCGEAFTIEFAGHTQECAAGVQKFPWVWFTQGHNAVRLTTVAQNVSVSYEWGDL